jgi:hypothetical protein
VPVYGCGFLGENSAWLADFKKMGEARAARWLSMWDPSVYLPRAKLPMLWVTGTNDFAYPMDSLQKSYRLPSGPRALCITVRMPHGHGGPGENPPENKKRGRESFSNEKIWRFPPFFRIRVLAKKTPDPFFAHFQTGRRPSQHLRRTFVVLGMAGRSPP